MWSRSRHAVAVLALVGGFVALTTTYRDAKAQVMKGGKVAVPGGPGAPGAAKKVAGYDLGSLTLPKDDKLKESIEFVTDCIKKKDWDKACGSSQLLMGRDEDVFVPITRVGSDGTETTAYVSIKKEAARLVASLPKEGRAIYETKYGGTAKTMVDRARTNNNRAEMAQAMGLYLYTDAGAEAANWLATWHLDRAEYMAAARYFQQLINRGGVDALKPRTLLKAAYAFHHAGDKAAKELVFKELERRNAEVKLRTETRSAADLQESVNRMMVSLSLQSASDSPIYRGRPNRTAMLPGGTPFLEPAWKQKMVHTERVRQQVKQAEMAMQTRNLPVLTAFTPVTATITQGDKKLPLLVYRSFQAIHVVEMETGKLLWTLNGDGDWSLDNVLGATGRDADTSYKVPTYTNWLGQWLQSSVRPQILFENSVVSTLACDSRMVYAVDDLPVPPPQSVTMFDPRMGMVNPNNLGTNISNAILHNKLQAFDLSKEGKLAWEIGGREEKDKLADTYFLGPPLPLNGRLYVLTEKAQELRLATLDPMTGKDLALQTLAFTKFLKLSQEPMRRIQACHLAYGEGVLVVPTNAGAVFGIDLLSNSLLWAYPYREKDEAAPNPAANPGGMMPPGMGGRFGGGGAVPAGWMMLPDGRVVQQPSNATHWVVTAPAVADGKVVFTAPDAKEIHCVNLRDGSRGWSQLRRPDDLFFAGVYNGKAIIVGKSRTRALSLAKGEVAWEVETGVPSGQGTAAAPNAAGEIIYYLPIREAMHTREPEICAINLDKGIIHAHTRSRKREVPGNLLFYEGTVLSQTQNDIVAYPQLEAKLAEMNRLVEANTNDPNALTERGDYLLDKGDLPGAIADFRKALRNNPPVVTLTKARQKLYEAFTEQFQRDFPRAEEYTKEYEDICRIDLTGKEGKERAALEAEQRKRRANFLCLVGKGREGQNRLVEAFDKYLELGLDSNQGEPIQVVDEPSVKAAPDIWAQGRIAAMVTNAKDADQKRALEDQIRQRWEKLKVSRAVPLDELRKFVGLFGSLFDVGKEARLTLAERLMEDPDVGSQLEAEQQLSLLRSEGEKPEVAARALEALARLNTRKGLLEDAAYYYRQLGERYPKVEIDGKSGLDYLEDLATDKRFLPYLDQAGRFVIKGKVTLKADPKGGSFAPSNRQFQFGHSGEPLPYFHRHKLSLGAEWNNQLRLTDVATGEERWRLTLPATHFRDIAMTNPAPHRARFSFQTMGHLVVLPMGHLVVGIDPLNKGRVLWTRNLSSLPGSETAPPAPISKLIDAKDNAVVVAYPDGWTQRLGEVGPLQGGVCCLQMRDSLTAIDPVSGRLLWSRMDVTSRSQVFGDDQHIYVVNISEAGTAASTTVLRAHDGVTVKVRDFSKEYDRRIRVTGRTILASETDAKNVLTLRLYDVLKGQDVWKQTFPVGTVLLKSEDPKLAGVAQPDGTIRVYDVQSQKEILTTKLDDAKPLDKAQAIYLVSDPDHLFLAVHGPADPNVAAWQGAGLQPNVLQDSGLRSVPVNGVVYCLDRNTGAVNWHNPVDNQHMIVSQFDELPVVLFAARHTTLGAVPNRQPTMKNAVVAWAKHNGKAWYANDSVETNNFFHALTMDHRTGTVEFTGNSLKVILSAVPK